MEEQLISFETAKLAKEKGFNIFTEYWYNKDREKCFIEHSDYCLSDYFDFKELYNGRIIAKEGIIFDPTQSLLQKWLREKHNIHVEINFMSRTLPFHDGYFIILRGIGYELNLDNDSQGNYRPILSEIHGGYEIFDSYEEALEIGLQEILKLI